jgi:hypothetical protein
MASMTKVKSCFVANGNEQNQELYPDRVSPTMVIHSILACLAVASNKKECVMSKVQGGCKRGVYSDGNFWTATLY